MRRKGYIVTLLFFSWVVGNIHRLWNNTSPVWIRPFPFDKQYEITWHWYIHTILKDLSILSVMMAIWLHIFSGLKRDKQITTVFSSVFIVQLIDLPHYILSARHSEVILAIQGVVLFIAALKITINAKPNG